VASSVCETVAQLADENDLEKNYNHQGAKRSNDIHRRADLNKHDYWKKHTKASTNNYVYSRAKQAPSVIPDPINPSSGVVIHQLPPF